MKRIFAFLLAFIYLSTSMGASIHLHYCMGKLVGWGFVNHEGKNCAYCGMPKNSGHAGLLMAKNGCCTDKHQELKTDSDQKLTPGELEWLKPLQHVSAFYTWISPEYPAFFVLTKKPLTHAPPVPGGQPVFLCNCNFRI